jgi:CTP synthase
VTKYIFVTGGVVSSLGKGITAASLGRLLKARGLNVMLQKLDPYINIDPGTMNPFQHGEVFVTDDGGETDLDLGHYERFTGVNLRRDSSVSAGAIYQTVIQKERRGDYLGGTVQVIPHVTNEIKTRIRRMGDNDNVDVVITEVGGTVGDIEGLPFLEAIRQFGKDVGRDNVAYIHVTLVPYIPSSEELKSKPTQHSVAELRSRGIHPDVIVVRSDRPIDDAIRDKISLFCDVDGDAVINALTASNLYEVPLMLHERGLDDVIVRSLKLDVPAPDLTSWNALVDRVGNAKGTVTIGVVGKYVDLPDAYLSVVESLRHGALAIDVKLDLRWVPSEEMTGLYAATHMEGLDGILVPGGFGPRGIEGKIEAIRFAREHNIPFLGLCLGLQCAVIEYARNVAGLTNAHSVEFDPTSPHTVIDLMESQQNVSEKGGTMRLGLYAAKLTKDSLVSDLYGEEVIYERHRHRFEVNNKYRANLEDAGLVLSGVSPDDNLVEIVELPDHPFFLASQFHPEFKSRPDNPHPMFEGFMRAAKIRRATAQSEISNTTDEATHPVG